MLIISCASSQRHSHLVQNLNPVPFWGVGAQICALNWQTFGAGMQLNEALFSGSDGYVLKPAALRADGSGKLSTGKMKKLHLHIAGASDVLSQTGATQTTSNRMSAVFSRIQMTWKRLPRNTRRRLTSTQTWLSAQRREPAAK